MQPIRIGVIGLGKIALEEHVPAIRADGAYEIVAGAGRDATLEGIPCFASLDEMFDAGPPLDAVAICTPPQLHYAMAKAALERHCHVLLEKPPCLTVAEFDDLVTTAAAKGASFFQAWHARETPVIEVAQRWLAGRRILGGGVVWTEDVRLSHPHQDWIWQADGFGVLDAGINAISILTRILSDPITVDHATLLVPSDCQSPIAARVGFRMQGAAIDADFDFRVPVIYERQITLETEDGTLTLLGHGSELLIDGRATAAAGQTSEYAELYRRFRELIARGASDNDKRPLELVVDIFRVAERIAIAPLSS